MRVVLVLGLTILAGCSRDDYDCVTVDQVIEVETDQYNSVLQITSPPDWEGRGINIWYRAEVTNLSANDCRFALYDFEKKVDTASLGPLVAEESAPDVPGLRKLVDVVMLAEQTREFPCCGPDDQHYFYDLGEPPMLDARLLLLGCADAHFQFQLDMEVDWCGSDVEPDQVDASLL